MSIRCIGKDPNQVDLDQPHSTTAKDKSLHCEGLKVRKPKDNGKKCTDAPRSIRSSVLFVGRVCVRGSSILNVLTGWIV